MYSGDISDIWAYIKYLEMRILALENEIKEIKNIK